jgi:hypothetical protein
VAANTAAEGAGKTNDGEAGNAAERQVVWENLASSATGEKLREQPTQLLELVHCNQGGTGQGAAEDMATFCRELAAYAPH